MKKKSGIVLIFFILFSFAAGYAQVATIHQNFDVVCVSTTPVLKWNYYNPIPATDPDGAWQCNASDGNGGTPGMQCSGIYGSPIAYHLDTSYLITPKLDMRSVGFGDKTYIQFDTKNTKVNLGAKLALEITVDSPFTASTVIIDSTNGVSPVFGNGDSTGWVTHRCDLSQFNGMQYYVAFRYISTATEGSIWCLDNVNVGSLSFILDATERQLQLQPLTVTATSAKGNIVVNYSTQYAGAYSVVLYDMVGRSRYTAMVNAREGQGAISISNTGLNSGMYIVKISDGKSCGFARTIVQ